METKYNFVKNKIKSQILQGFIQPHQKVGSETELMKEYEVSRHTVRKAIDELVNDGWIYKKQGAGTFCADRSALKSGTAGQQTKNIAVITTYFSDYIFPSIIRGIEGYLSKNGYQVTLFSTNNNIEQERRCLEAVLQQGFDGLIVEPTKSALPNPNINYYLNLERTGIPYVMINAYYEELEPTHLIMNDVEGGRIQTRHVLDLGHQYVLGFFKNDDIQGTKRMKGFIKAHRESGIPLSPKNIITYTTETKETVPVEELRQHLTNTSELPTAIVCYNDQLALMLLDVIRDMKLSVPEDISVVGYDDSFLSVASEVKLTTVKHPKEEMGKEAGRRIYNFIEQKLAPSRHFEMTPVVYEPKIIIRNSTQGLGVKEIN
ncbi:GntR family transcriptional regulator [Salipaludibacillus agaradhaerens]|uniref:GntR family transcriptional regulator n=1 Tax=Salipaludibacillus agaradhaerens TaxID=76935 RepID=A0A9Q4AXF4_SALAG|nr:GntR family transcriptional regulator [Salipaludibacillus agaradhaerens]MCR6094948.1 GntR family transcriptional regulator [Salipaludibacillus agaradhaerens]MCR6115494.1 GntR family transcriptional regulator [Salipaludibacillus agaradhaerens]